MKHHGFESGLGNPRCHIRSDTHSLAIRSCVSLTHLRPLLCWMNLERAACSRGSKGRRVCGRDRPGTFRLTRGQSAREVRPNTHRAVTHAGAATPRPLRRAALWTAGTPRPDRAEGRCGEKGRSRSTSQGSADPRKPEAGSTD